MVVAPQKDAHKIDARNLLRRLLRTTESARIAHKFQAPEFFAKWRKGCETREGLSYDNRAQKVTSTNRPTCPQFIDREEF
jgi:hypothetical protein